MDEYETRQFFEDINQPKEDLWVDLRLCKDTPIVANINCRNLSHLEEIMIDSDIKPICWVKVAGGWKIKEL